MSWNIRRDLGVLALRGADRWEGRGPRARALLRAERPALLGVQEALPHQVDLLRDSLGEHVRAVGRGRGANGGGEASPILYDSARLDLLDWQQRALSDTPERPGSVSWGNLIPRIVVAATFRDRATSRRFLHVNTHLDHLSARSRVRSAQAIRALIVDSGLPAMVTGDFNDAAGSAPHRALLEGGLLVDAWETADARASEPWGTFANYRPPRAGGRRLDWILTSPSLPVVSAAIHARTYGGGLTSGGGAASDDGRASKGGRWPSDHLPVQAVVRLGETDPSRRLPPEYDQ